MITMRRVAKSLEEDHLATAVENAVKNSGLKYERVVNDIQVK